MKVWKSLFGEQTDKKYDKKKPLYSTKYHQNCNMKLSEKAWPYSEGIKYPFDLEQVTTKDQGQQSIASVWQV